QVDASSGFELVAPEEGLQDAIGFARRHILLEPGDEVRKLAQGIEFAGEKLVEVGFGDTRVADDDGISGQIAQSLAFPIEPAGQSADEIKQRQRIDESQEVADDNLVEL